MMSEEFLSALMALANRLIQLSAEDAALRTQLRQAAAAFLAATEQDSGEADDLAIESATDSVAEPAEARSTEDLRPSKPATPVQEPLPALTLGSRSPSPALSSKPEKVAPPRPTELDLSIIEKRCRLKAEGSRWAATRQRLLNEGADFGSEIDPTDKDIIERAKTLPDCFLWMNSRNSPIPPDPGLWEDVAGCFDAVAAAVALIRLIQTEQPLRQALFEKALDLLAESQLALRVAVGMIQDRTDTDQVEVFNWLKQTTAQQQILVERYMRASDTIDPATWANIATRIDALDTQLRTIQQKRKSQESQIRKVRYHLNIIQAGKGSDHDWKTIIDAVSEMVDKGLPPSNVELRDLLVPVLDDMPDSGELPTAFQRVLSEIDRFLVSRPIEREARPVTPSPEVREVAGLLSGRSALLIGGLRRPSAKESLESAFGLKELIWFETREHESVSIFEATIAQPDVAVVLLAIRWSSHSYGEVRQFCEKHGKAFVRLPGGYSPNQVAMQILRQAREQLGNA